MTPQQALQKRVEAYRRMAPQQRLRIGFAFNDLTRTRIRLSILHEYPEWDDQRVERELRKRLLLAAGIPEDHPCWHDSSGFKEGR